MVIYALIAALTVMLTSLTGVLFAWKELGAWMRKNISYLVTFAAGVFLITAYDLATEALHGGLSLLELAVGIIAGGALLEAADQIIPDSHHHHSESECGHGHSVIDARRMLFGDAIHNVIDGMLLVPAFLVDIRVGIATTSAILLHELVQEVSEFFVLREAGYSSKGAVIRNFLVSSTILIGLVVSILISSVETLVVPLLAFSGGGFLYIVVRDLLPSTLSSIRKKGGGMRHLLAGLLGIAAMIAVGMVFPH